MDSANAFCFCWFDLMRASFGEMIFLATANLRVFFAFPIVDVVAVVVVVVVLLLRKYYLSSLVVLFCGL